MLTRPHVIRLSLGLAVREPGWRGRLSVRLSLLCTLVFLLAVSGSAFAQLTGFDAENAIGRENRTRADSIVESVDTATGAFLFETAAMSVFGGRDVIVDLAYNALLTGVSGSLGPGWSHPFEAFIDGDPNAVVTVHWSRQKSNQFQFVPGQTFYEPLDLTVRWDRLRRTNDDGWRLELLDGTTYLFDANGQLEKIGNKVQQFLDVGYTELGSGLQVVGGIHEPISDRRIFFMYRKDGTNLLQHLQDAEDRVVLFDYDDQGRLVGIYDPVTLSFVEGENFPAIPIPDNTPSGIVHTINVTRDRPIGLVLIDTAMLNHDRPSDLQLRLVSPQGTTVDFTTDQTTSPWDLSQVLLDAYQGENPQGTWRVEVADLIAGSTGFLNTFRIKFTDPTMAWRFEYNANHQITRIVAPDGGQVLANAYDARGRVVAQEDGIATHEPARFVYEEQQNHLVTTSTNRMGATSQWVHDGNYNLIDMTDPLGSTTRFAYDANGDVIRVTDALGRETTFAYDPLTGTLKSLTDPAGHETTYEYDSERNVRVITDALDKTTIFQYDGGNNLNKITDAENNVDEREYGPNSQVQNALFAGGGRVSYGYTRGLPTSATDSTGGITRATYDNIGRVLTLKDAEDRTTTFVYNDRSQLLERTDGLGNTTRWEVDRRGRQTAQIDRKGNRSTYAYDGNDNLIEVVNTLGERTRFEYDGENRLVRIVDAIGNARTFTYDAAGQMVAETDPMGNVTRMEYDAVGNLTVVRDGDGVAVETITYDDRDQPIQVADALGNVTRVDNDELGRVARVTDPLARTTTFDYDLLDRPSAATDPLGRRSLRTYVADDMTRRLEQPGGNGWSFRYDEAKRIDTITAPWGTTTSLEYNTGDLLETVFFPSGRRVEFEYNGSNDISKLSRAGGGAPRTEIEFAYDENGNVTQVRSDSGDHGGPLVRTYDALNRMVSFTDAHGDTIRYGYDSAGHLRELTYPDGKTVQYNYDATGSLVSIIDWAGRTTTYTYDHNGRLIQTDLPNGMSRQIDYDQANQITRLSDLSPEGMAILEYQYTYDAAGQVTVESSGISRPPYRAQPVTMTYLPGHNRIATYNGQQVFYDNDGNLASGPLGDSLADFRYDPIGNLTSAGPVPYEYDAEDRLIAFADGSGGRTLLTVNPMPELSEVLVQTDNTGAQTRYVWGLGLVYAEVNGEVRVHHYDLRGSTVAFSNGNGAVVGTVSYGPWGELGERNGETDSLFLFNGLLGVITEANGLNYMRFRWYSPQLKRFLTPDSLFGDIDDVTSMNRYAFADNNPVLLTDPNGQIAPFLIALFVAIGVGSASAGVTAVVDLAVTGELGPPERYAAAFGAGFAVAVCPGCGIFTGAVVGAVGGAAFGFGGALIADAAEDGRVENVDQAGQAALEGAILGALTGATAGLTSVAGSASVARQAVAQQAARGAGRQAARGAIRAARGAGRAGRGARAVRGRGGNAARGRAQGRGGNRGNRHRRNSINDRQSEVSEVLPRVQPGQVREVTRQANRQGQIFESSVLRQAGIRSGSPGSGAARHHATANGRSQLNSGTQNRFGEHRHLNGHNRNVSRARRNPENRPGGR